MSIERVLLNQVEQWRKTLDEVEDLIESAYVQLDAGLEGGEKEQLLKQIYEWKRTRDEMEDLVDGTYFELDHVQGY